MPLVHGKSKKAFQHNVETEMNEHPGNRAQNLAIAYAIKRKAQKHKMAMGGYAEGGEPKKDDVPESDPKKVKEFVKGATSSGYEPGKWMKNLKEGLGIAGQEMAEGGEVNEMASGFVDHEGNDIKHDHMAMEEDDRMLNQHGEHEEGPQGAHMAHGGQIHDGHQSEAHEMDMVGRIMKMRQHMYSEGGKVANGGEDDLDEMADGRPNNFDDLSMRDDLESSYTGANSGDELGNAREDHDRHDIVARIMASRKKKDRMPHPA